MIAALALAGLPAQETTAPAPSPTPYSPQTTLRQIIEQATKQ